MGDSQCRDSTVRHNRIRMPEDGVHLQHVRSDSKECYDIDTRDSDRQQNLQKTHHTMKRGGNDHCAADNKRLDMLIEAQRTLVAKAKHRMTVAEVQYNTTQYTRTHVRRGQYGP